MIKKLVTIVCLSLSWHGVHAQFDSGRAGFSITVNNEIYPYREFATYVLPSEHLGICINDKIDEEFQVTPGSGQLIHIGDCRWVWIAPDKPGFTTLEITRTADSESMILNVFVLTPAVLLEEGILNGVMIGEYPPPVDSSPLYLPPDGYIEVTKENLSTKVSPHFVLGQFVTPLDENFPKYIVLKERLLLKLEALVERLNERGYPVESLSVIAGYMTPAYSESTGRDTYSRHIYGGAAAIIVDTDANGSMDDFDRNGKLDQNDGQVFFNLIDELYSEPGKSYLSGGLFFFRQTRNRPAYIMLDSRGYRKRWNDAETGPAPLPQILVPKHGRQFNSSDGG